MAARRPSPGSSSRIGEFVRLAVLGWSAALLTASYMGLLPKMDPTFIASIFTGSVGWYGISKIERSDNSRNSKP